MLGETDGQEIIQVTGHKTYRDDGELRMTTVCVTQPGARRQPLQLMSDWLNPDDAVYPYDAVYAPEDDRRGEPRGGRRSQMVTSQDAATAVALRELGYDVTPVIEVAAVDQGTPADGELKVGDVLLEVDGTPITTAEDVGDGRHAATPGEPVELRGPARRQGRHDRRVDHAERRSTARRGSASRSAPASSSRSTYGQHRPRHRRAERRADVLAGDLRHPHPGSLTGGEVVAGTGTIDADGKVGPIGGIQQKIVGARDDGAELFLVPAGQLRRRARAPATATCGWCGPTPCMQRSQAIEAWVEDPDADLPTCAATTEDDGDVTGELTAGRPRRRPGAGRRRARDRDPHRRRRLGPAGPALRAGRHRRAGRAGAALAARDGPRRGRRPRGSLTPVEQDQLAPDQPLEQVAGVDRLARRRRRLRRRRRAAGAAARTPTARSPRTPPRPQEFAREHPDRQEVRIVAGATRAGATYCALRLRAHDDDQSVVGRRRPGARPAGRCCATTLDDDEPDDA